MEIVGRHSREWNLPSITEVHLRRVLIVLVTIFGFGCSVGRSQDDVTIPKPANRFAILVGVDKYNDSKTAPTFSDLTASTNDVFLMKKALIQDLDFNNDNIFILADSTHASASPTRENIINVLYQLRTKVEDPAKSLLIFMFTGHGVSVGDTSFLVPSASYYFGSPQFAQRSYLSIQDVSAIIQDLGFNNVLVFLDSCRDSLPTIKGSRSGYNPLKSGFYFAKDLPHPQTAAFFYATEFGEESYVHAKNSYFTEALVDGLNGKAQDESGQVTTKSLANYLATNVRDLARKDGRVQIPTSDINPGAAKLILVPSNHHGDLKSAVPLNSPLLRTTEVRNVLDLLQNEHDELLDLAEQENKKCDAFLNHVEQRKNRNIGLAEDTSRVDSLERAIKVARPNDPETLDAQKEIDWRKKRITVEEVPFYKQQVDYWNNLYQKDFSVTLNRLFEAVPEPPSGDIRQGFNTGQVGYSNPTMGFDSFRYIHYGCQLMKTFTEQYARQLIQSNEPQKQFY